MRGRTGFIVGLVVCASLCVAVSASAIVVERIVAVVGERAILLSDLRKRATPFLLRVHAQPMPEAQRNAAISQVYRTTLERMVDEELEARAAAQARVTVTAQEVDHALKVIASQNQVSPEDLIDEAKRQGMTEAQYRSELRRQVIQQKMANLRLQGRIRITEEDLKSTYRSLLLEERSQLDFRAAQVVIAIPAGASKATIQAKRRLALQVSRRASQGEDFRQLVEQYSDDQASKAVGGLLPPQKPIQLPNELSRPIMNLDVGEATPPLKYNGSFVVLKLIERGSSGLPPYEQARGQLRERVYMEKMARARRHWLDSLKRRTHVDIRL
jgi:peptidyl-prolyl cis-trans isomerase SurA